MDTLIVGIGRPTVLLTEGGDGLIRMSTGATSEQTSETVRDHRNAVRDASERVSAMDRNPHAALPRVARCWPKPRLGRYPQTTASMATNTSTFCARPWRLGTVGSA